jgi:hypothetical protein
MVRTMTSNVEIPGDRIYQGKLLISSDLSGSVVLDFVDPKTYNSVGLVYMSTDDIKELLEYLHDHADILTEKKKEAKFEGSVQDDTPQ